MIDKVAPDFSLMWHNGHILGRMALDVSKMTGLPYVIERISTLGDVLPHLPTYNLKWWDKWRVLWAIIGGNEAGGHSLVDDTFEVKARILQEKKHARSNYARNLASTNTIGSPG